MTTPTAQDTVAPPPPQPPQKRAVGRPVALLLVALAVLLALCLASIAIGSQQIPPDQVFQTLFDRHGAAGTSRHQVEAIVWDLRVPRTLLGLLAGMALGLSGTVMQALTRNPLADPGLMGVTAGAGFAMVIAVGVLGLGSLYGYVWFAFGGALVTSVAVYLLGGLGRGGMTPVKLALAGIAVTTLLSSVTNAISLVNPDALNRFRFWSAGSLSGQGMDVVVRVLPFLLIGMVLALSAAPALNALALGDDVAVSLGGRLGLIRLQAALAVTLLTGGAVAVTGPIVFIGLVVPHAARAIAQSTGAGPDHRWLLPLSMVLAPILVLAADILGRVVARPQEVQVGIVSAFIGAPFFIALVRRRRLAEL